MSDVSILESAPTVMGLLAFVILIVIGLVARTGQQNSNMAEKATDQAQKMAEKALDAKTDTLPAKQMLDVLLAQTENNRQMLVQSQTRIDNEAARLEVLLAQFKTAHDEREATNRTVLSSTIQVIEKVATVESIAKGGQTMLDQLLEKIIGLEAQMAEIRALVLSLPDTLAQKSPITKGLEKMAGEASDLETEINVAIAETDQEKRASA